MTAKLLALATVLAWSVTFVSTKVLLVDFRPIEILFIRFVLGTAVLFVMRPQGLKVRKRSHEALFALAGATGVAAYYLLENIALVTANASTVGVVVAVAPLFTAVVATALGRERCLTVRFVAGFILAMVGIVSVGIAEGDGLDFAEPGVLLAVAAAAVWAVYSNTVAAISALGYESIAVTKRTFLWGLLFMAPLLPVMGARVESLAHLADPVNAANMLFLGVVACALCFAMWGYAVSRLGASRTGVFIYLSPAITVAASIIVLGEPFTPVVVAGLALTIVGVAVSQGKPSAGSEPVAARKGGLGAKGACARDEWDN